MPLILLAALVYTFRIVHAYPHDTRAFTQGLEYRDGYLYEGTGLNGRSTLRKEELETGRVLEEIALPEQYFGEGITVLPGRILQLTWQSQTGFIYNRDSFRLLKTFHYAGEGWGLAHDARHIYMSDGSAQVRVLDPETLAEERRIAVHDGSQSIDRLNELECVRGEIFANIWGSDRIARISPEDGRVLSWIDPLVCSPLPTAPPRPTCSTASLTMRPATASSSPANSGRSCSRSASDRWNPVKRTPRP